jgi:2-methylcitrate dehydratase PrpD
MSEIGDELGRVGWSSVSEATREKLRLCIVANVVVALAGTRYARLPPPVSAATGFTLLSGGYTADARDAAWFNATLMHARNQDDFHPEGRLHVGTIVIPTALAVAQSTSADSVGFLDSIVAGYAAGVGISRPHGTPVTQRGFRATGVFGPFAAAAAAARGYGLGPETFGHAMAIATSLAGGLNQCWIDGSHEWQLHAAESARSGLHAANLASAGCKGGRRAFFGNAGFVKAFAGIEADAYSFDADRAVAEIVIKRYSVSGINQSVVSVAEQLVKRHGIAQKPIRRIRVGLHATDALYPGTSGVTSFQSFADRMMSTAFCAASVFHRGGYEFGDMFDTAIFPERDALMQSASVEVDPTVVPFGCRIDVEMEDGQVYSDAMTNPACALALDWGSVDEWASALWAESGRDVQRYREFKEVMLSLDRLPLSDFVAAIA